MAPPGGRPGQGTRGQMAKNAAAIRQAQNVAARSQAKEPEEEKKQLIVQTTSGKTSVSHVTVDATNGTLPSNIDPQPGCQE